MKNPPKETKEERERRLKDYEAAMKMLKVWSSKIEITSHLFTTYADLKEENQ